LVGLILAWPLLIVLAATLMWRHRGEVGGRGLRWFLIWIGVGFLMSISLITGFSIGMFILPFAGAALIWAARRAPHLPEASGFVGGIGAAALLVAAIAV
jgi:hypothetical protein